jgi:hypothetical protein
MTILSTQEGKYEMKTFNGNFAKKVRICCLPFPETRSLNSLLLCCYNVIFRNLNFHLDDTVNTRTMKFNEMLDIFGLKQHITPVLIPLQWRTVEYREFKIALLVYN